MQINTNQIERKTVYEIFVNSILPRPIAWVSSISDSGINNLAPFSFFNVCCVEPPILGFAPGFKDSNKTIPKDTLANIKANGEFVINIVSYDIAEKMFQTSTNCPPDISEFSLAGLTPIDSTIVKPARVAESKINFECSLYQLVELGSNTLVLGEVLCIHIDDQIIKDGQIDLDLLQPIGRLGKDQYTTVKDRFSMHF